MRPEFTPVSWSIRQLFVLAAGSGIAAGACLDLGSGEWQPEAPNHNGQAQDPPDGMREPGDTMQDLDATCPRQDGEPVEFQVEIVSNSFRPKEITICAGDTVHWTNLDTKEHTVFSGTPEVPTGMMASLKLYYGDTFRQTFETVGDVLYFCSTHKKKMRDNKVIVR